MIASAPPPPTSPPPADPTAVMGRRIVAYLVDAIIGFAIAIGVFAAVASTADVPPAYADAQSYCDSISEVVDDYACIAAGDDTVFLAEDSDIALIGLSLLAYVLAGQVILPALTGFSPGKAMVGLRVVDKETFAKAGLGATIVRWLLWIVDSAPWCFPLVGLITGLSSNGHRRVGDMAAGTLVVDRQWMGTPLAVAGVNTVAAAATPTPVMGAPAAPPASPPPMPAGAPPSAAPPPPGAAPTVAAPPPPTVPPPDSGSIAPPAAPPTAPPTTPPPPSGTPVESVPPPTDPGTTELFADFAPPEGSDDATPTSPEAPAAPPEPPAAPPPPEPQPPAPRPGIDAPQWDAARDTYIQWDPELQEWMEWSEARGEWIPISR